MWQGEGAGNLGWVLCKEGSNIHTCIYSPYRAVNTLRLGYTNQSVNAVKGNNRCLFSDPHKYTRVNRR